jgi:DNA end-binding protein Ku
MVEEWDWEKYRDEYRDDLLARIRAKAKGGAAKEIKQPAERPAGAKVVDLMALLKQSVEEGGRPERRASSPATRTRRRQTAQRRSA